MTDWKDIYSLNERPEGMPFEEYKFLRRVQNKFRKLYLQSPAAFEAMIKKLQKENLIKKK